MGIIWLVGAIIDRFWIALDNSVPSWDPADYLNGAMNYWYALQDPQWFSGDWWRSFWLLSTKIPPLTYIITAPFLNLFGTSQDSATLVLLLFNALLLVSVYGLGRILFSSEVGLWAAAICQLLPALSRYRLIYLLDYPVTAIVAFSFWLLTLWYLSPISKSKESHGAGFFRLFKKYAPWWRAAAFGLALGVALMVKQTTLLFLLLPLLWVLIVNLQQRNWLKLVQLIFGSSLSLLIWGFWYRTNWLLIFTAGKRATVDSAIIEGDPALNSLDAWTYYGKVLPYLISWPLLLVPIVGWLLYCFRFVRSPLTPLNKGGNGQSPLTLFKKWLSPLAPLIKGGDKKPLIKGGDKKPLIKGGDKKPLIKGGDKKPLIKGGDKKQGRDKKQGGDKKGLKEGKGRVRNWLVVFLLGGYFFSSLNINKDPRYILPLLPVLSLLLAVGLLSWKGRWRNRIRWGTLGLAFLLMLLNLFPLKGEWITNILSPYGRHYPYLGASWPHEEVISEIIATSPYEKTTLGVLPSTTEINQHNFSFYGSLANFQVYGRQVGVREHEVEQDGRSLDWFLTKTGNQGSVPEPQAAMVKTIEEGEDFRLQKSWPLPDDSTLKLYHRRQPTLEVKPMAENRVLVQLDKVIVPEKVPPGEPVPVTYEWIGSGSQLRSGLAILTWANDDGSSFWLHDRGYQLTMNNEQLTIKNNPNDSSFKVIERTAMLPGKDVAAGNYHLEGTYLNWETGEIYPLIVPPVTLTIDPDAPIVPAPELDLITQLRTAAKGLARGREGLDPIFAQTARINQYDAIQAYLKQAELTLAYRLEQEQDRDRLDKLNWVYTMGLARVLQQDVKGAISTFRQAIELEPNNPYNYAYLAFIYLYDWQGKEAAKVLKPALEINPDMLELKALRGIAALMQGKLIQAWYYLSQVDFGNL